MGFNGRSRRVARMNVIIASLSVLACVIDKPTGNPVPPPPPPPPLAGWHVAPGGSGNGSGSIGQPWSLAFAFSGANGRIQPGDTVWLHGGTYRGAFVETVAGSAGKPILFRQYPGERAIIDVAFSTSTTTRGDAFVVKGAWTTWWGFEMTNSDPNRGTNTRANMIVNDAPNTKYINLIVHDGGIGWYTYAQFSPVELSGNIFYNNGWQGPVQGGGHALYLKNDAGPLLVRHNIMFNQYGYGIQVYSEPGDGALVNITLDGNVSFNNGSISTQYNTSGNANLLMGGMQPITRGRVLNNLTYFSPGVGVYNMVMGFENYANVDVAMQNNYVVGGASALTVGFWQTLAANGNEIFGSDRVMQLKDTVLNGFQWIGNSFHRDPVATAWQYNGVDYPFVSWRQNTGLGQTDEVFTTTPATRVFVQPNDYEPGRATVVVYNWGGQSSVNVNLSAVLSTGASYEIRNVQDLFGSPVAAGTFGGSNVTIPLGGVTPPAPVGGAAHQPPRTGPDFDVFIVTSSS
jgi:hypothetical protein